MEYTYPNFSAPIAGRNEFIMMMILLELFPKAMNLNIRVFGTFNDIVESNYATRSNQFRIQSVVTLHPFIGMITVDKQKIQQFSFKGIL